MNDERVIERKSERERETEIERVGEGGREWESDSQKTSTDS